MARIVEILGAANHGDYCTVEVLLDNQETASVYVGGQCEVYFHKGKLKAFVKKGAGPLKPA